MIPFFVLVPLWIGISFLFGKYELKKCINIRWILRTIFLCNAIILSVATSLMFIVQQVHFSRLIVLGTVALITLFEFIVSIVLINLKQAGNFWEPSDNRGIELEEPGKKQIAKEEVFEKIDISRFQNNLIRDIVSLAGENVYRYISGFLDLDYQKCTVVATTTVFNISRLEENKTESIINLKPINDIRRINKFFEAVNLKIPMGGYFVCCVETFGTRRRRIFNKYPVVISTIVYTIDFIFRRVFPKIWGMKTIYFALTQGKNRVFSKAETLGRLVSCGFRIIHFDHFNELLFVIVKKEGLPFYDPNPTYGPLIKMNRIGKNGKMIKVYKFRTMHPFSEYLQSYIFEKHNLERGGKFRDDFRVNALGRIMRKLWIDELPMILNVFKGEMKIVGVRPLSQHFFNLYTKELQEMRTRFKPGLVPPFYVDKPETLEEIMASEMKYLKEYEKKPIRTDLKYLFRSMYNIIFRKYRSA